MDSVHEAHLARILEARRRRGVLGVFKDFAYVGPVKSCVYRKTSPPPPPTPPPSPQPPSSRGERRSSSTGTQTLGDRNVQTGTQTRSSCVTAGVREHQSAVQAATSISTTLSFGWRQTTSQRVAADPAAEEEVAAAPFPHLTASPRPNPNATLSGGVRFQSPSRVPSLAYSTPASASRPRCASPWRAASSASPASTLFVGAEERERPVEPLPPPLFLPRTRSSPQMPLRPEPPSGTTAWQARTVTPRPLEAKQPSYFAWRIRSASTTHPSPLPPWRSSTPGPASRWSVMAPTLPLAEGWRSSSAGKERSGHERRYPSRHRSHHRRERFPRPSSNSSEDEEGREGASTSRHRRGTSGRRALASHTRLRSADSMRNSQKENEADNLEDKGYNANASGRRRRRQQQQLQRLPICGHGYAPPVVYMGPVDETDRLSSSSREGSLHRRRSTTGATRGQRSTPQASQPKPATRKVALGLPDARSTVDLRTSIENLRAGDWFYKWTIKGDAVRRRWVWVDTKSYLLVWSHRETFDAHFCSYVRLDNICQVTARDLASVDQDGFPKTYYVLLIETPKRVLQLATELKEKSDAWFEALNNVMGFIHRHGMANGALIPD